MTDFYDESKEWAAFADDVTTNLLPKMAASAFVMSIMPETPDVKICVEMGAAVMMDKPILAIAMPGHPVPEKLRRIADEVVVVDMNDKADAEKAIQAAVLRMLGMGP